MKNAMFQERRAGFSLVELLVALTITAVIGVAMTGLFMTQARFLEIQQKQEAARSVTRGATNVMMSEMRMLDRDSGVAFASDTALVLRVPFAMGINCAETATTVSFMLMPIDSVMYAQGVAAMVAGQGGFAFRNADETFTYVPLSTAPATGLNTLCTAAPPGMIVPAGFLVKTLTTTSLYTISRGQPIMLYHNVRYHFNSSTTVSGRRGLFRQAAGVDEEISAPFDTTANFDYYVNDAKVAQASAPSNLKTLTGIDLILNSVSEKPNANGTYTLVPNRTAVFFKNRRN